jgi:hypothetical protein
MNIEGLQKSPQKHTWITDKFFEFIKDLPTIEDKWAMDMSLFSPE